MTAHRVEVTLNQDGSLTLDGLPFYAGEAVEVIILSRTTLAGAQSAGALRGSVIQFVNPTEPVAQEDWEALR